MYDLLIIKLTYVWTYVYVIRYVIMLSFISIYICICLQSNSHLFARKVNFDWFTSTLLDFLSIVLFAPYTEYWDEYDLRANWQGCAFLNLSPSWVKLNMKMRGHTFICNRVKLGINTWYTNNVSSSMLFNERSVSFNFF